MPSTLSNPRVFGVPGLKKRTRKAFGIRKKEKDNDSTWVPFIWCKFQHMICMSVASRDAAAAPESEWAVLGSVIYCLWHCFFSHEANSAEIIYKCENTAEFKWLLIEPLALWVFLEIDRKWLQLNLLQSVRVEFVSEWVPNWWYDFPNCEYLFYYFSSLNKWKSHICIVVLLRLSSSVNPHRGSPDRDGGVS